MAAQSNQSFKLNLLHRPRRLRKSAAIRGLVNEVELGVEHLIQPVFVIDGEGVAEPIEAMPGMERLSIDQLLKNCRELQNLGSSSSAVPVSGSAAKNG